MTSNEQAATGFLKYIGRQSGTIPRLRAFIVWVAGMFAVGAVVTAVLLTLLLATELLPAAPILQNLRQSVSEGSLQSDDWPADRTLGLNQYNDCLLVMMVRFREAPLSSAAAPMVVFNDYPRLLLDAEGNRRTQCSIAIEGVQSDNPRNILPHDSYYPYSRYVHGYRIPFHLLASFQTVGDIRVIYRAIIVTLLLLIIVGQLFRTYRAIRSSCLDKAVAGLSVAGIATAFLLFSGIDLFAQSLTHGPSDIVLISALCYLSFANFRRGISFDVTIAGLAGMSFGFDFLHGTIPMMFAICVGTTGLRAFAERKRLTLFDLVRIGSAFVLGLAGAVAAKLLGIFIMLGWAELLGFFHQLSYRISGDEFTFLNAARSLKQSAYVIGFGSETVAIVAVIVGVLAAAGAMLIVLLGRMASYRRMALLTALMSIASIFAWYALFRNHTTIHAIFMVRMLTWPIGMGFACLLLAIVALREHRTGKGC